MNFIFLKSSLHKYSTHTLYTFPITLQGVRDEEDFRSIFSGGVEP